ncbi:DUF503 domain-containing protein [Peptoniphilus catoniae]|uniref:DUF503 domain-containing protein n=1 Tax=Peptoniphilus catoniae TaxID=1660341 RepID=UPI001FE9AD55|nr:DUF503 domain-containing protein [Peptoniphilus catoniae]
MSRYGIIMTIGRCVIELRLYSPNSLKEKRRILKSLIEKLKNRFNISIAEVGKNDLWQSALIGIAIVSKDKTFANEVINKVIDFIDNFDSVEIVDIDIEMID